MNLWYIIVQQVDQRLSRLDKSGEKTDDQKKKEKCDRYQYFWAQVIGGFGIVIIVSSFFFAKFHFANIEHVKSQISHLLDYSKKGMEFPKIVICDNVNSMNSGSAENLKHISCSLIENGLLGDQRRNHSCTQPYIQRMQLYRRNCLVYGNKSAGLSLQMATSASTTLRLVLNVGTHNGTFETPWKGAFMFIQNPFHAAPPDVANGLVRTYVLSPNVYHLIEMKRQSIYTPSRHATVTRKIYEPPDRTLQYVVNTPETGPLSELYAARYNSQTIAVIDFQFTTLRQDNIVEESVASVYNFFTEVGSILGLMALGYYIILVLIKLGGLCCCTSTGECKRSNAGTTGKAKTTGEAETTGKAETMDEAKTTGKAKTTDETKL